MSSTAVIAETSATSGSDLRPVRPLKTILDPLDRITAGCTRILSTAHGHFESDGRSYQLPRYLYIGRPGGGEMMRVGIFAAIHGDEPEGALALAKFLELLAGVPEIGEGYALFIYPICNPTGFEDNTRHSRSGRDLNREFWTGTQEPEVRVLESEIREQAFDGIITLHSDDTSDGLYGFVRGAVLSEHLLKPALLNAGRHLPRNHREKIDGFDARHGIIHSGYPGMLQSQPGISHPPFEITLETPQLAPIHRQVDSLVAALSTVLTEYRYLQALGQNI
ncbi:MAG: succinylglutamate desuccinylase/aspartoacylase family protein [Verrucomicrobiales bacterium]|nr:succinylglutamate desuccinylase/aspartoacylase family protein [Verrucomicrobiales bacterium]